VLLLIYAIYCSLFTVANAQGTSVSTCHLLATDLNTENGTSNHWSLLAISYSITLEPQNSTKNSFWLQADSCYTAAARTMQKTQFYCCTAQTTQKTSHVTAKYCWSVTPLRLCGSVFTESLPRSWLHNPIVPLLVCVLLRNGCFCGSTVLAWGEYTTIPIHNRALTRNSVYILTTIITFSSPKAKAPAERQTHTYKRKKQGIIRHNNHLICAITLETEYVQSLFITCNQWNNKKFSLKKIIRKTIMMMTSVQQNPDLTLEHTSYNNSGFQNHWWMWINYSYFIRTDLFNIKHKHCSYFIITDNVIHIKFKIIKIIAT
jgi:hypothetical protein